MESYLGSFPWQEHCVLAYSQFSECKLALNAQAGMKLPRSRNPQSRVTEIISISLVFNNWVFFSVFFVHKYFRQWALWFINPQSQISEVKKEVVSLLTAEAWNTVDMLVQKSK